jgi:vitamin B12 transporter
VTLVGDVVYVGHRHDVHFYPVEPFQMAERLPTYTVVGIAGSLALGRVMRTNGVELTARVDNLLDEEYEAVAGFATPGRTASLGARLRFGR